MDVRVGHGHLATTTFSVSDAQIFHVTCSYRNQADSRFLAVWNHLALFFSVKEIIVVLHADEFVPAVPFGNVLKHLEFPGRHL